MGSEKTKPEEVVKQQLNRQQLLTRAIIINILRQNLGIGLVKDLQRKQLYDRHMGRLFDWFVTETVGCQEVVSRIDFSDIPPLGSKDYDPRLFLDYINGLIDQYPTENPPFGGPVLIKEVLEFDPAFVLDELGKME